MKFIYSVLCVSILFFSSSCTNKINKDTRVFNNYLTSHFNRPIADNETTYIIVSAKACSGCLVYIHKSISKYKNSKEIMFVVPKQFATAQNIHFSNVLIDTTGDLRTLKFHGGNIGKVVTKAKRIIEQKTYNPYELETIFN